MSFDNPLLSIKYSDSPTGIEGYLVIHRYVRGVAAGGLRIHANLTMDEIGQLAKNMTMKQAVAGVRVGGAKSGLRMDPAHPQRPEILRRFLATIAPLVSQSYSVGPDMNTSMSELEELGRSVGIASLKLAVGRSRQIPDQEFLRRYALFDDKTKTGPKVNDLRGAASVYAACRVALEELGIPAEHARVALQGAGNMGGAAAHLLSQSGIKIVAWADDTGSWINPSGLPVDMMFAKRERGRLSGSVEHAERAPADAVLRVPCDILVLAAISNAVSSAAGAALQTRAIVQAANLALAPEVESDLSQRGLLVIPDVVANAGGSLAVEALYAGHVSTPDDIIEHVKARAAEVVRDNLRTSKAERVQPRQAAVLQAEKTLRQEGVL